MTILTGQSIEILTGCKQPKAQQRYLAKLGIKPLVRADGTLAVTESAVTQAMLSTPKKRFEPNFDALK